MCSLIFLFIFFYNRVSYTFRKYSDFLKTKIFQIFQGIIELCSANTYTKKPKTSFVDIVISQPIKQNGLLGDNYIKNIKKKKMYIAENMKILQFGGQFKWAY